MRLQDAAFQGFEAEGGAHSLPNNSRCFSKARTRAAFGSGGLRMLSAKRRWSSTERRMISVVSMVCRAASLDAATTKSVNVRPCISAARFSIAWAWTGKRASRRAVGDFVSFMLYVYGSITYRADYFKASISPWLSTFV